MKPHNNLWTLLWLDTPETVDDRILHCVEDEIYYMVSSGLSELVGDQVDVLKHYVQKEMEEIHEIC